MKIDKNVESKFNKKSLEDCLNEIENIQRELNSENLPLEKMMELYEYGKIISKISQKKLDNIQFRFEELNKNDK